MSRSAAEIVQEYGLFPGVDHVRGVTYNGQYIWFAAGEKLNAIDPSSGKVLRSIDVAAHAGTAFDGQHLFQLAEDRIQKIDPKTGRVLATIPAPGNGGDSGLAWAEGTLWIGQYRERKIHQVDPDTGKILRTIESNRFVTGVTWVEGELWHATLEGDESELRRIDPQTGKVFERLDMPRGNGVSGLERLDEPEKNWKFEETDVREREHWTDYMAAYEDMIVHTAKKHAPWYVVPADHKWFTHLVVSAIIVEAIGELQLSFPKIDKARRKELQHARSLLLHE